MKGVTVKKQQKTDKPLKLEKEVLLVLSQPELQKAVGGLSFVSCDTMRVSCG